MILAEATTINIAVSWPAAALISAILGTAITAYIYLNRRVDEHMRDNDRHLTGENYVKEDVCRVTKEAMQSDHKETRKFISDVNHKLGKLIDKLL